MTQQTATQIAISDTFKDFERSIHESVFSHYKIHGGNLEDLFSEAQDAFLEAYTTYNIDQASFHTWMKLKINFRLLDFTRKSRKKKLYEKNITKELNEFPERQKFSISLLSDDAQKVIMLAINPPEDVMLVASNSKGCVSPSGIRKGISEYLKTEGWSLEKIIRVINEIQESLE